jgi:hypothetical protein
LTREDPALTREDPALTREDPALTREDPALTREDPALTREERLEVFAGFPTRLAEAATAAEGHPVSPGEWRPSEVVRHLIAVEREVWQARLAQVAAEDDPHWPWAEPGLAAGFDSASLGEILAAFANARAATAATIRSLDEAGSARSGIHSTYGVLDVVGLVRIAIDHDEDHLGGLSGATRP